MVRLLSRMVLMQQEQLQATLSSTSVVVHLSRGGASIVEIMLEASRRWKECMSEDASKIREPLRLVMFKSLMSALLLRHTELLKESAASAASHTVLNAERCYYEVHWDEKQDRLVPLHRGRTLTLEAFTKLLEEISQLTSALSVERVKCLRPISKLGDMTALPILITCASSTTEGMRVLASLRSLCRMSCWNLISAGMREEKGKNTQLTEQLRKKLYRD